MSLLSRVAGYWRYVFRRRQVEQDLRDELSAYVDDLTERRVQGGQSPESARQSALIEAGGLDQIQRQIRRRRVRGLQRVAVAALGAIVCFVAGGATASVVHWDSLPWVESILGPRRQPATAFRGVRAPVSQVYTRGFGFDAEPGHGLHGLILDRDTRRPLANVKVVIYPRQDIYLPQIETLPKIAITDEWGRFLFLKPPLGPYRMVVRERDMVIIVNGDFETDVHLDSATDRIHPITVATNPTNPEKGSFRSVYRGEFALTFASNGEYSASVTTKDGRPTDGGMVKGKRFCFRWQCAPPTGGGYRLFHYATDQIEILLAPNARRDRKQALELRRL